MPTPIHRHPSRAQPSRKRGEEGPRHINVVLGPRDASVDDGGFDRLAGRRVADADLRPAFRVGVGVAAVGNLGVVCGISLLSFPLLNAMTRYAEKEVGGVVEGC